MQVCACTFECISENMWDKHFEDIYMNMKEKDSPNGIRKDEIWQRWGKWDVTDKCE